MTLRILVASILVFVRCPASDFPAIYNSELDKSDPMPAAEAAAKWNLAAGFKATVFAAEPDVQNPIAMTWDNRGRIWVAENYTYAERSNRFDLHLRDRVLILEDKDGDGHFDTRKVFTDEVQILTSVEVGQGGVWLMCPPRLLFIPDANRDDVPDGPPQVVLDGFTVPTENYHNFANGLRFGLDGWLYGRCGASSPGEIGAPGTPVEQRIPMRGTIWRYHPKRKVFEALSAGTTNPWGHDWDEHGELFFINTVNGHLWHQIPGAHFVRPHTIDPNPHAYEMIDQHADHWHFDTVAGWAKSREGSANSLGGGHAHIGMMIYLADNWPAEYRGNLFTINMHGRRANQEILERTGSGYVGHHGQDILFSADTWFRGMELTYGPDGGVFVADWSDTGECHESTGVHRTSGRIFKITHDTPKQPGNVDLTKLSAMELVALQRHTNEWFVRHARLELAGRQLENRDDVVRALRKMFDEAASDVLQLRALWSLNMIGAADRDFLLKQLKNPSEHVRVWAIRLFTDAWPLDTVLSQRPTTKETGSALPQFVEMAEKDSSGLVRLALASTLQRLPVSQRTKLAAALCTRKEDANDHNLPLMIWYGLIPVADANPQSLAALAAECELPTTRKLMARRLAEEGDKNSAPLEQLLWLASTKPIELRRDVLQGMSDALKGVRKATKPTTWETFAKSAPNEPLVRDLSVVFGDGRALDELRKIVFDQNADIALRKSALQSLIDAKPADLRDLCERSLNVQFLNPVAARGLAAFDDPAVGAKLVRAYRQFHPSERPQLLATLVSRPAFADAVLDAIAEKKLPRAEITPFHVRQIRGLQDAALNKKLSEVWGELREGNSAERIATWKTQLTPATLATADLRHGRAVFVLACAPCHTLYGEGGKVGPDLTGSGRDNLDYLLENIVDPSAVVTADFRMSVLKLKDGRVLNGLIAEKSERTIKLKTMTEELTLDRQDIVTIDSSPLSLMPEGLLDSLQPSQARDLIAYLMQPAQQALP